MLSNAEREYLRRIKKGMKKIKPKPQTHLNVESNIRKKVRQPMKDLTLIFETLAPTELHFYKEDWFEFGLPLVTTLHYFEHNAWFFEDIRDSYIALALEKAGKRYDYKRLATNERYKQRMIDWLVKNGKEFWKPPTTEEQKRRWEKLKDMMREAVRSLTKEEINKIYGRNLWHMHRTIIRSMGLPYEGDVFICVNKEGEICVRAQNHT